MNYYLTVSAVKRHLGISSSDDDAALAEYIEAASREVDAFCRRYFYTASETRLIEPQSGTMADIDDLLTIVTAELIDPEDSSVAAVEYAAAQYQLQPLNNYPKLRLKLHSTAPQAWVAGTASLRIEGVWGYGDGTDDPWLAQSLTGTVASTTGTALTISVSAGLERGQTIKVGSEQMFVSSVATTTATVRRGVNGTTAATHSAAAISLAQYPAQIKQACRELVSMAINRRAMAGQNNEAVDGYSVGMASEEQAVLMLIRVCGDHPRGS